MSHTFALCHMFLLYNEHGHCSLLFFSSHLISPSLSHLFFLNSPSQSPFCTCHHIFVSLCDASPLPSLTHPIPSRPILSCHASPFPAVPPHPVLSNPFQCHLSPFFRTIPSLPICLCFLPCPLIHVSPLPHIFLSFSSLISAVTVILTLRLKY